MLASVPGHHTEITLVVSDLVKVRRKRGSSGAFERIVTCNLRPNGAQSSFKLDRTQFSLL